MSDKRYVMMKDDLFENLRLELRRGCLTLAMLAQLRVEHHGYALRKALTDLGLVTDENMHYPLLRRLENQGLLVSEWLSIKAFKSRYPQTA